VISPGSGGRITPQARKRIAALLADPAAPLTLAIRNTQEMTVRDFEAFGVLDDLGGITA
jgi:hypothetical protein